MSSPASSSKVGSPKILKNSSSGQSSPRISEPKDAEPSSPGGVKPSEALAQPNALPPSDPPKYEDPDRDAEASSPKSASHGEISATSSTPQRQQPQGDVSAEERYALEIRLLMEMGFSV